jgi:hypothetical protein
MIIKDYKPGDENAILELFELVFGKPMSAKYWNWRFNKNPLNKIMIKLMWDDSKLVGHYAVSPVMLDYEKQYVLTGLSMTTMTHPDYAGRGIFQQLSENLYKDISTKDNVTAVWGFPNNNSHRGFIKNLAWKDLTTMPMMFCNTQKLKAKENADITQLNQFTDVHANIYVDCFSNYKIKVKRDTNFLTWRYIDNPENDYYIIEIEKGEKGFVVCKEYMTDNAEEKKQIDIIDWCVPNNEDLTKNIMQHLVYLFPSEKYSQYNIWMPIQDERHLYFEKLGFVNSLPITYWGVCMFKNDVFTNANDWWIQLGDSDVY